MPMHQPDFVLVRCPKATPCMSSIDGPYLLGPLSYLDFLFGEYADEMELLFPGFLDDLPQIKALRTALFSLPNVAAFVKQQGEIDVNNCLALIHKPNQKEYVHVPLPLTM